MPLLDGKHVDATEIDPAKHRFLGAFRPPTPPDPGRCNLLCPCGEILKYVGQEFRHWQAGHFDEPQYVTIEEK